MAVAATVAAALAAFFAAVAVGGFEVAGVRVPALLYGGLLVVPLAAVIFGRRPGPPAFAVPEWVRRNGRLVAMVAVLALIAFPARLVQAGSALVALTAVGVLVSSWWWPRPVFVRAAVPLSALMLFRSGVPSPSGPALGLVGASAAVALVTTTRLVTSSTRPLSGAPAPVRPLRVTAEALAVVLMMAAAALVASHVQTPRQPRFGQGERAGGQAPREEQPAPLDLADAIEPGAAGAGGRGDGDRVVLRVGADRPGVLRAVTYDQWDGRQWLRSSALTGPAPQHGPIVYVVGDVDTSPRLGAGTQRVTIEAAFAAVAVGTPRVFLYEVPGGGQSDLDGTVRLLPPLGKGATYTVRNSPGDATAAELRTTSAGAGYPGYPAPGAAEGEDAVPPALPGPYVAARPVLSDRALALVDRLTAGTTTDYDRVKSLSDHLAATVILDDRVPAVPAGTDVVDDVLFGSRTATQQRLATTLALLARAAGIPARLATGFLPGQRSLFGGDFTIRVRDAHTWVEVPFAGYGWQAFDPSGRIAAAQRADSLWNRLKRAWGRFWPLVVLVVVIGLAVVAVKLVRRRRKLNATPWVTRYYARLTRLGRKRGRPKGPAETPVEYARALAEGPLMDDRLVEVGAVVTAAAWSPTEPSAEDKAFAELVLADVKRTKPPSRAR